MEDLFSGKEWIGEFFVPDQFEKRFLGKVSFSPESGIVLSYNFVGDELPTDSKILHGVLESGEKCSLIGKFSPALSGICVKNGLSTRKGRNGFYFLVLGEFVNNDELFNEVSFSLTGMQEFFFPKGHKSLVKFSNQPLFNVKTDYGEIKVGNNANFSFLGKDITSQIYNSNEQALDELEAAFESISAKHKNSFFMLKNDISYVVTLKTNSECDIHSLYEHIRVEFPGFSGHQYSAVWRPPQIPQD